MAIVKKQSSNRSIQAAPAWVNAQLKYDKNGRLILLTMKSSGYREKPVFALVEREIAKHYLLQSKVKATHPTSTEIRITKVWEIFKIICTVTNLLDTIANVIAVL